jgi:hypothetical protein
VTRDDIAEIDALTARFFAAFTNAGGKTAEVDGLYGMFVPQAVITKCSASQPEVMTVEQFVEPRRRLLAAGTLVDFEEREVWGRTRIFGGIAQRFSVYEKSGLVSGTQWSARGVKTMQFVRTDAGWRVLSLAWEDEREGLTSPVQGTASISTT